MITKNYDEHDQTMIQLKTD